MACITQLFNEDPNRLLAKNCILIGNGPSLNKVSTELLSLYPSFGSNCIFYMKEDNGFTPTYHVVEDNKVFEENKDAIAAYDGPTKIYPREYCEKLESHQFDFQFELDQGFYLKSSKCYGIPRFNCQQSKVLYSGQSVTIVMLQIAFNLGFRNIFLVGMDFNYVTNSQNIKSENNNHIVSQGDDPNHFNAKYFGKGKTWKDPKLNRVLRSYFHAQSMFRSFGGCIYNSTEGGKLEIFPRLKLSETSSLFC